MTAPIERYRSNISDERENAGHITDKIKMSSSTSNNDSERFVNTFLDLHDLLSDESHHSNDWKTDFEKKIYGDLRALDASSLFESLLNFLLDDTHTVKREVEEMTARSTRGESGYNGIDKLLELNEEDYDVKTLVTGNLLRGENHRKALALEITHGNKYAGLFAAIVNVMYRYLKLSKIIWVHFWGVTKIEDIFTSRTLSQEENEEKSEARKRTIQKINHIIAQHKSKKYTDQNDDKINTKFAERNEPPMKTIIVDVIYPYLLALKNIE